MTVDGLPLDPDTRLHGNWLILARIAWAILALAILSLFTLALPYRIDQLLQDPYQISPVLQGFGLTNNHFVAYATIIEGFLVLGSIIIAVVIFWRKSDDWMGLLVSLSLLSFLSILPVIPALAESRPEFTGLVLFLRYLGAAALMLIYYLFPNGRFAPSWTRYLAILFGTVTILWLVIPGMSPPAAPIDTRSWQDASGLVYVILMLGSGVYAQVYRYRRVSSAVQRQQTKWVLAGLAGVFTGFFILTLPVFLFPSLRIPSQERAIYLVIEIPLTLLSWFLLPLSLGISILKYRLWDIDIIVRRTLVYGALTGTLALIYASSIILLQRIFETISRQHSAISIVISTLLIYALFNPLRRRIQNDIDRRFYRKKYDAQRILESFSASARNEVELEQLVAQLLQVMEETLQPKHVSLMLKQVEGDRKK